MRVSVVIVSFNNADLINGCIRSVQEQSPSPEEIIIIDQASADGSPAMIRNEYPDVVLVALDENIGFAAGMNRGISAARGEYILALNSDMVLGPRYIEALVTALAADETVGWASGKLFRLIDGNRTQVIDSTGHELTHNWYIHNRGTGEIDRGQYDLPQYIFGACAAAALYKRCMLEELRVGDEYFDEDFFSYYEDADLDWRAQLAGWKCAYVPAAQAHHIRGASGGDAMPAMRIHQVKNRYLMAIKNDSWIHFVRNGGDIFLAECWTIVRGRNGTLSQWWRAIKIVLRLLPRMLKKRQLATRRQRVCARDRARMFIPYPYGNRGSCDSTAETARDEPCRGKKRPEHNRHYRILYVIASSARAGTEQELLLLLKHQDNSQFQSLIVCAHPGPLISVLEQSGFRVMLMSGITTLNLTSHLQFSWLLKREHIDLVCLIGNRLAGITAKLRGIPVVQRRNQPSQRIRKLGRIRLVNRLLDIFVDRIIAVSDSVRQNIICDEGLDPGKITTIYNGIDAAAVVDRCRMTIDLGEYKVCPDRPVVGVVARLEEQKGHVYLLPAAALVLGEVPDAQFVLIGEGSLRMRLEQLAQDLGIRQQVYFCGFQAEIPAWMSCCDMVVLPSLWEGFPFVLLEAMACQCPIIATRCGGVPEMLTHGSSALLVPPADVDALTRQMLKLLSDRSRGREMAEEARRNVTSRFPVQAMIRQTERVYRELIERGKN